MYPPMITKTKRPTTAIPKKTMRLEFADGELGAAGIVAAESVGDLESSKAQYLQKRASASTALLQLGQEIGFAGVIFIPPNRVQGD